MNDDQLQFAFGHYTKQGQRQTVALVSPVISGAQINQLLIISLRTLEV